MNCFLRPKTYHDTSWAHPFLRVVDHGCSIMISLLGCIPTPASARSTTAQRILVAAAIRPAVCHVQLTMIDTDTHGTAHSQTHKEQPTAGDTEKHQKKKTQDSRRHANTEISIGLTTMSPQTKSDPHNTQTHCYNAAVEPRWLEPKFATPSLLDFPRHLTHVRSVVHRFRTWLLKSAQLSALSKNHVNISCWTYGSDSV